MSYICIFLELLFLAVINRWQRNGKLLIDDKIVWFFNGVFLTSILYTFVIKMLLDNILIEVEYLQFLLEKSFEFF